jgi:hypothetical protein
VFDGDDGPDPATNVPVADDLHPTRVDGRYNVVEDSVRDVLVEGSLVPVRPEIEFEGLEFDTQFVGDVFDDELCEIGLAREWAEAGELRSLEGDGVVTAGVRIWEGVEGSCWCFGHAVDDTEGQRGDV